jgi:hypothetical protein
MTTHEPVTMDQMNDDPEFRKFVRETTGTQPVFFAELVAILKLLWDIYQFLKEKGIITRWMVKRQVKAAMRFSTAREKEVALYNIRNKIKGA